MLVECPESRWSPAASFCRVRRRIHHYVDPPLPMLVKRSVLCKSAHEAVAVVQDRVSSAPKIFVQSTTASLVQYSRRIAKGTQPFPGFCVTWSLGHGRCAFVAASSAPSLSNICARSFEHESRRHAAADGVTLNHRKVKPLRSLCHVLLSTPFLTYGSLEPGTCAHFSGVSCGLTRLTASIVVTGKPQSLRHTHAT